ncbi:MAG: Lar family restriction alleviation protein [Oscillospiraceae bacterium]|nr:Lar family restriction alleviation protein [Oscillospiraceae bacterium]
MSKLKPCPFCGGKAHVQGHGYGTEEYRVYCEECGCSTKQWAETKDKAIAAWDLRAQPANEPLTLEQLRQMYDEPVWVVCGIYKDWRIPEFIDEGGYKGFIKFTDRSAEPISDYGKTWLAYAHKPGGEQE